ncbi:LOW QUALITY PROTEIN: uncharacterized protein [Amphiura filiformis]|uniref:LOW QUALITY PROTEIN: uncharacterized protein n=1 Tax=Amphiura filiformis TaxID=82378 RepID=UPI003B222CC0
MEAPQRNALLALSNKISAEISADKVMRELATLGTLHPVQIEDINSHKTSKLKSARLLELLTSCGPKAFLTFYDVLMKNGYRKLAEQLRKSTKDNKVADDNVKMQLEQDRSMLPAPRGYDDALRNCKEAFICDVWSEHLMALLGDQDLIGEHTRQIIDGGTSREERAELLFWNLVHQLQKKGHSAFVVLQDTLEQSYPHIGDLLWENVKSIVAPPRSSMESRAARGAYSRINNDEKTDENHDEKQDHEHTREGDEEEEGVDSNDVIETLEDLQNELSDTKTDNIRHSMQLERAIQVIAEANGTIRVLEARVLNLEQERDNANLEADMARKEAGECRIQVEVVRRGREQERTRQQDHLVKWEAQQKERMNQLDQKDAKLRSKENGLKRREDDVQQQLQVTKKQQSEIERRTKDLLHKTDMQEKKQEELNSREEKVRQKDRLLRRREDDVSSREDDVSRKEEIISKGEVKLKRREIEAKRLEEQLKIMQEEINRQDAILRKKEDECRRKEQDQQIQDENLQKREDGLKQKERRVKMKLSDLRQQEEEQKMKEEELREKDKDIVKKDHELKSKDKDITQRAIDVESREKDCEEREEKLEQDEEELSRRESKVTSKEEACSNLQYILNQRNAEQEKIDRTLKMMELEQRRMELEQIRREQALIVKEQEQMESERLNESQGQQKLQQLRAKMEAVERRANELEQKEELLGRIELEQRMRELEYTINDAEDGDDFEDSGIMDSKPESVFSDAGIIEEEENFREYIIVQKGVRNADPQSKPFFTVKVSAPHIISTLKTILAAEEGIPVSWQRLYINNRLLDDSSELPDSDVPSEMALDMKLVIPSGKVRIPVKASRGAANIVEFDPTETVACAKVRIFKHGGIPPHQQRLLYRDKPLEEHCTIESLNLRKNAIIHLRLRLRINAQISRTDTIPVTIDESDTVEQLKEIIQEETQLPADTMKIYYNKRELDDHRPVSHFGITEDATLQITHSITFAIRPGTDSVSIEIDPGASARQLKQLLRRKNLKIERPTIIAGDKVLNDEQTIMEALQKGDTFEIHSGNVLVVLETGEIIRNAKIQTGSNKKGSPQKGSVHRGHSVDASI